MLPDATLLPPGSLAAVLAWFAPLFTAPSFRTFCGLACGFLAQTGKRTVCGILTGAGLARTWSHDRPHSFFARARWSPDDLGLPPRSSSCPPLRSVYFRSVRGSGSVQHRDNTDEAALCDRFGGPAKGIRHGHEISSMQVSWAVAASSGKWSQGIRPSCTQSWGVDWVNDAMGAVAVAAALSAAQRDQQFRELWRPAL